MKRHRVLHVVQNLNYGGMERVMADLVHGMDPDRYELHLLTLQYRGRFGAGLDARATLHQAGPQPRWTFLHPRGLADQIRGIAPDLVHTHSGVWFKVSLAARMAGVPCIVHTEHGRKNPDPWSDRFIDWLAARRTDTVVGVSPLLAEHLRARVVRGACDVAQISNGIDTALYAPKVDSGAILAELRLPAGTPIIGSIGRLEPIKGYDVMIRAFAELRARWTGDDAPVLIVAGDGSERARVSELAATLGILPAVHLLGWRDDPTDLLASYALFTMSSRSEGTSISLLEAMSSGRCPVVTDVGGNAAVLGFPLRHRLVPSEDPASLAAAWEAVLRDPERRRVDEVTARSRVEAGYGLQAMVDGYDGLYQRLLGRAAG
ncbi:MAG: glycosyltransferase [Gemmatimonadota bacterium]